MRTSGSIAEVQRTVPGGSWCRLREPETDLATLLELAIGATLCSAVFTLWVVATPLNFGSLDDFALATIAVIAIVVALLHEFTHVWAFPRLDGGPRAVVRFSLRLILHASYDGVVSRERYLAVLVAPLAVVSLLPLLLASLSATTPAPLLVVSLLNALASSGDVLTFVLVACQVPRGGEIRSGNDTLAWKYRQAVA
jgi:Putative zincin peptidase